MVEKCELLEKCGFFKKFSGNLDVVKEGWIQLFCENKEKSEKCQRKKIRRETGQPPVDNMTPTGKIIG